MSDDTGLNKLNRREFVKRASLLGSGVAAAVALGARNGQGDVPATANGEATSATIGKSTPPKDLAPIPKRKFGRHDDMVSIIGLGGFHLGISKDEKLATRIVHEAVDHGINFMDNCWDYHKGESEVFMGNALATGGYRDKVFLMTKVCTHGRDAKVAMKQLEDSLSRLKTDHIDLWQIHEVAYFNDPENHFAPGGVIEALLKAKEQGKVRYLGFTGHKSPELHKRMLDHDFPFDAVQMPLNPFDASFRSFQTEILPILNERGIAALGMKSMSGDGSPVKAGVISPQEALRYAMSLPVTVTVSGIPSLEVLYQNLEVAGGFKPMSKDEQVALAKRCEGVAADGRFELFKTTAKFEGDEGRKQHDFPLQKQAPA